MLKSITRDLPVYPPATAKHHLWRLSLPQSCSPLSVIGHILGHRKPKRLNILTQITFEIHFWPMKLFFLLKKRKYSSIRLANTVCLTGGQINSRHGESKWNMNGGNEGSNSPITHRKMARNCDFGDILSEFATATIEQKRLSLNKEQYPLKTLHAISHFFFLC